MFYTTEKNWNKILGYAEEAYSKHKSEIGGMSVMVRDNDGDWELQDPVILKQEISGGNTILEKEALAVYYTKKAKKMGKKEFRFCWWHSHHTMGAFWSGTDLTAIDEYSDGDFSFALVINLKEEYKFRTSVWNPVEIHQDVELEIMRAKKCTKSMKKEIEDLCSTHSYSYSWKKPDGTYNSYKNTFQTTNKVEDPRQERLPFRTTAGLTTLSGKMPYCDIIDIIDELNGELVEGSIMYQDYKTSLDTLNAKLDKEDNRYRVTVIEEGQVSTLLHIWPAQLIESKDGIDIETFDDSFYGSFI